MSISAKSRFLDSTTPPHLATLVVAAAFGPFAMTIFLPSLPNIARYFNTDYAVAQLAISLYLASTALLQLVIGPASDRFGRRPVMIGCIAISLVATLVGVYAPTIEVFLAARIVQGTAVAGMAIGRAVIRDTVGPNAAASKIGYMTMAMTLAPMFAPFIGGYLDEVFGWQAAFWLIFAFGAVAFALAWADLGETHLTRGGSLASQIRAWPLLLRSSLFWAYAATAALTGGAYFAFLGGGPYIASEHFRLTPSQFGIYFALMAIGYLAGNFISGRFAIHIGIHRMMLAGGAIASVGMILALALVFAGVGQPAAVFGPVVCIGLGNGVALPSANAGIVSVEPRLAGAASGLGGCLQIGGGAALSVLAGVLIGPQAEPGPLLWLMLISSALAVLAALYASSAAKSAQVLVKPGVA